MEKKELQIKETKSMDKLRQFIQVLNSNLLLEVTTTLQAKEERI